MQQVLTKAHGEYDIIDEAVSRASDALEDILLCLEELVDINPNILSVCSCTFEFSISSRTILRIGNLRVSNTNNV